MIGIVLIFGALWFLTLPYAVIKDRIDASRRIKREAAMLGKMKC